MAKQNNFEQALNELLNQAEQLGVSCRQTRNGVQKFGAVEYLKSERKKGLQSEGFAQLAKLGRLDLSIEALIANSPYSTLFDDEEVNACFYDLIDAGYTKFS